MWCVAGLCSLVGSVSQFMRHRGGLPVCRWRHPVREQDVPRFSPFMRRHLTVHGHYSFQLPNLPAARCAIPANSPADGAACLARRLRGQVGAGGWFLSGQSVHRACAPVQPVDGSHRLGGCD